MQRSAGIIDFSGALQVLPSMENIVCRAKGIYRRTLRIANPRRKSWWHVFDAVVFEIFLTAWSTHISIILQPDCVWAYRYTFDKASDM